MAVGPALSGLLVAAVGWRSVFLVDAAVAALGVLWARGALEETASAGKPRGFDWAGQALSTLALGALVAAITAAAPGGWGPEAAAALVAVAAGAGFGFVRAEARAEYPIAPPAALSNGRVGAAMAVGFAVSFCIFGLVFGLSLLFQRARGYTALEAGLAFVPFSLAVIAGNVAGSRVAAKVGAARVPLAGLLVAFVGSAALGWTLGPETTYLEELPAQSLARIGIGLAAPTVTALLLASMPQEAAGVASGAFTAVWQAGAAVGVAATGALMAADPVAGLRTALAVSAALLIAAAAMAAVRLRQSGVG